MTRVSVIIPAFQAESHIVTAIGSVLAQTRPADEVVIISDDGQDYRELLRHHAMDSASIRYVQTGGIGTGASNARNCGLEIATGDIIATLDADDRLAENYLETLVPLATEHGAALSQVCFIDASSGAELENCSKPYPPGVLPLEDAYSACVHTYAGLVYDRRRIDSRWHSDIPLLEDAVFLAECCAMLGGVYYSPRPLYYYTHRNDSQCNQPGDAERFIEAGHIIERLIGEGEVCHDSEPVQHVLLAYLARNEHIERLLQRAMAEGKAANYQQFIRMNRELLHTPLT